MQRSSDIRSYGLRATDGAIGHIDDLLFDDEHWGLRWVVVDTGTWLPGRKVLLPPSALGSPDPSKQEYAIDLSRERIEAAPELETDAPVSRQLETDIYAHYDWAPYWYGGFGYPVAAAAPVGTSAAPPPGAGDTDVPRSEQAPEGDPHLRSANEVTGYYVEATDGSIGHVEDFLIDEGAWAIRYLMIDTKNWWPGKMVLISPHWLRDIAWDERRVFVEAQREKVKGAPEFEPSMTLDREYEERLYTHYGHQPYWAGWA